VPLNGGMGKENLVYTHNGIFFILKEWNYVICRKMNGTGDHHVDQDKSSSERQLSHIFLSYEDFGPKIIT
jgi:hypothetical protein